MDQDAPALHPELIDIADLTLDPENARLHDDRNVSTIGASLEAYQQRKAIVVNRRTMTVEAGNGTVRAALEAGHEQIVAVFVDDDDETAAAYAIADNRTADLATWDLDVLTTKVEAFPDVDWGALGFGPEDLASLAGEPAKPSGDGGDPKPDPPTPEPPAVPVTQPGDIWTLGDHRLICGSCRDPETVARLLDGATVNVAFTSPPYASQRKYDESSGFKPIKPDDYVDWFEAVQANVREHLADDGSWFVNIKEHSEGLVLSLYVKDLVIAHARRWDWLPASEYVWERSGMPGYPKRRFKNQFEPVFHFASAEWKFRPKNVQHATDEVPTYSPDNKWSSGLAPVAGDTGGGWANKPTGGMAYPGNRLPTLGQGNETSHAASFPIGLPTFFIKAYSDPDDVILDPFMGSGTVIIACEREGRRGYGCEISPGYCDVIVERWETETGRKAERT